MIVDINDIERVVMAEKFAGHPIVFTNGCFDLFHIGHLSILQAAKGYGSKLVVGVNSDVSVARIKGAGRPLVGEMQRALLVDALKPVDYVVIFDDDTPFDLIRRVRPNVLVKGGDYPPGSIVGEKFVAEYGGTTVRIPLVNGISSTTLMRKIRELKSIEPMTREWRDVTSDT